MPLKKPTSKISVTPPKQVQQAWQKARRRPYALIAAVALVPLAVLLLYTFRAGASHSPKSETGAANTILVRQTPQEVAEEATLALRKNDTMAFFDILDTKVKDPNIVNTHGDSLLLAAATLGNVEAVQRLLAMGADVNKQNAYSRDTAILRSVYGEHDEITRLLIYQDADLNLPNNYGQTPMGLAVEKQKGELVDLFLTSGVKAGLDSNTLLRASANKNFVGVLGMLKGGVDPNIKNEPGNTPLIVSASVGDTQSVRALLAYRADVNAANNNGNTALLYAARYNHPETVLALLAPLTMQYKADVNMQNKRGETALYWAAAKGYAPIVKILLANDADKTLKTTAGLTALDAAQKYKRTEVIKLLEMTPQEVKELFNQARESQMAADAAQRARQAQADAAQTQAKRTAK